MADNVVLCLWGEIHVKDRNQIGYRNSCTLHPVATEKKQYFEKTMLASCWEDKTKQKGFPLEKEEITCSEEGVFSDILFFAWYNSYLVEPCIGIELNCALNCATVTQVIKCVWIVKHIWTERKEYWRLKNGKSSFNRGKGLSNSQNDSLYIPSMSMQQLQP